MKQNKRGIIPFGLKTSDDFFVPSNCGWATIYNSGESDVQLLYTFSNWKEAEIQDYLSCLLTQPDTGQIEIDGKMYTCVIVHIPGGGCYSVPDWEWGKFKRIKVATNGNLVYFNSQ